LTVSAAAARDGPVPACYDRASIATPGASAMASGAGNMTPNLLEKKAKSAANFTFDNCARVRFDCSIVAKDGAWRGMTG